MASAYTLFCMCAFIMNQQIAAALCCPSIFNLKFNVSLLLHVAGMFSGKRPHHSPAPACAHGLLTPTSGHADIVPAAVGVLFAYASR
jgi:hypothetical protein